ncbi:hypothetical protein [Streptomyces yaizuensis]|uniref:Uncharacterized protein n=1 Tax=Streptomyces yaizuensis TaxID=2989713 RepID=A0ABQ5PB36_9ACTN|nr:hypothetical protein [Streptomyces sp. YSPA8]GLF99789.1 hypothetical protein SYYSPA8_35850 [Streptomyces sp. YSPA8]
MKTSSEKQSKDLAVMVARLRGNGPWQWVVLEPMQGWTAGTPDVLRRTEAGLQRYLKEVVDREQK